MVFAHKLHHGVVEHHAVGAHREHVVVVCLGADHQRNALDVVEKVVFVDGLPEHQLVVKRPDVPRVVVAHEVLEHHRGVGGLRRPVEQLQVDQPVLGGPDAVVHRLGVCAGGRLHHGEKRRELVRDVARERVEEAGVLAEETVERGVGRQLAQAGGQGGEVFEQRARVVVVGLVQVRRFLDVELERHELGQVDGGAEELGEVGPAVADEPVEPEPREGEFCAAVPEHLEELEPHRVAVFPVHGVGPVERLERQLVHFLKLHRGERSRGVRREKPGELHGARRQAGRLALVVYLEVGKPGEVEKAGLATRRRLERLHRQR